MTPAGSVDEIVERLNLVVARARGENSRTAYFAVLYRLTTEAVRAGLETGRFEDPVRLARLTVVFAERYFDAAERFMRGDSVALSWDTAFRAASNWQPVVAQHLLLGMNAHINYDLGIAAVQAAAGSELPHLRRDFDAINAVFGELIERVQLALIRVWPTLRLLDLLGGRTDEKLINFSIRRARDAAWSAAERLVRLEGDAQLAELHRIDSETQALARKILTPGIKLTSALLIVRLQERGDDVSTIVGWLDAAPEVRALLRSI